MDKQTEILKDYIIYGFYIEKDGKRIDPKDFYKCDCLKETIGNDCRCQGCCESKGDYRDDN